MKAQAIMESVAADLIERLESADPHAWVMPWHGSGAAIPTNVVTGNAYRGGNIVALWVGAMRLGTSSNWWATYKQWASIGAHVRKGERGTHCVKWTRVVDRDDEDLDEHDQRTRLIPRGFVVFNASQVDGWEPETRPDSDIDPIAHAEEFFDALGADVRHDPGRAFYNRSEDCIGLPRIGQFDDAERYYSTLAHEHVHWTGHSSRLDRERSARFGSESYAFEELIAELGAAFVCAVLGISSHPRDDHAQYLAAWAQVLRGDPAAIWRAASAGQRAVDWMVAHFDAEHTQEVAA